MYKLDSLAGFLGGCYVGDIWDPFVCYIGT